MARSISEIRDEGLLERYALGDLGLHERSEVEAALAADADLRTELREIEVALYRYAQAHRRPAPDAVLDRVLADASKSPLAAVKRPARDRSTTTSSGGNSRIGTWLLAAASLGALFFGFYQLNERQNDRTAYVAQLSDCDELAKQRQVLLAKVDEYEQLGRPGTRVVSVAATEKYPETEIVLHTNNATQTNFLQLQNLPALTDAQSFQLWSLKSDSDPIPLDVFETEDGRVFLKVDHVDNTNAYAITIEQRGGAESPNLADLIGVFDLSAG